MTIGTFSPEVNAVFLLGAITFTLHFFLETLYNHLPLSTTAARVAKLESSLDTMRQKLLAQGLLDESEAMDKDDSVALIRALRETRIQLKSKKSDYERACVRNPPLKTPTPLSRETVTHLVAVTMDALSDLCAATMDQKDAEKLGLTARPRRDFNGNELLRAVAHAEALSEIYHRLLMSCAHSRIDLSSIFEENVKSGSRRGATLVLERDQGDAPIKFRGKDGRFAKEEDVR